MPPKPRLINVEPLILLFNIGQQIFQTLYQPVFTYKQCLERRPLEHHFCQILGADKDQLNDPETKALLNQVQVSTSQYMILYQAVSTIPSVIIALFIGSWSDTYGRKLPLILASAGYAMAICVAILCVTVDAIPATFLLLSAFIRGCSGDSIVLNLASFAMISDAVATMENSASSFTIRVGIASGLASAGSTLGSLLAGALLDIFGNYAYVYIVSCVFMTLATIYAVCVLEETLHWSQNCVQPTPSYTPRPIPSPTLGQKDKGANRLDSIEEVLVEDSLEDEDTLEQQVPRHWTVNTLITMKETFKVLIVKRPGRKRLYLLICYFSVLALDAAQPLGIFYLFAKRPPFSLTDADFGYLIAMLNGAVVISKMVCAVLLKRFLHLTDLSLILLGLCITIADCTTTAFATTKWMLMITTIIGSLQSLQVIGFKSYFGSLVENSEKGRLFAAVFILDVLGPLLSSVIVNNLYAVTLPVFPGTVFLLKTGVCAVVLFILSWMFIDSRTKIRAMKLDPLGSAEENEHLLGEKTPLLLKK